MDKIWHLSQEFTSYFLFKQVFNGFAGGAQLCRYQYTEDIWY